MMPLSFWTVVGDDVACLHSFRKQVCLAIGLNHVAPNRNLQSQRKLRREVLELV